jgi:hypothetical protein
MELAELQPTKIRCITLPNPKRGGLLNVTIKLNQSNSSKQHDRKFLDFFIHEFVNVIIWATNGNQTHVHKAQRPGPDH